jgi:hypothetical protein
MRYVVSFLLCVWSHAAIADTLLICEAHSFANLTDGTSKSSNHDFYLSFTSSDAELVGQEIYCPSVKQSVVGSTSIEIICNDHSWVRSSVSVDRRTGEFVYSQYVLAEKVMLLIRGDCKISTQMF